MEPARAAHRVGPRDRHGVQRIRDCLQMPLRQMQIDDRVLEFDVPEQQLHGPQVGPRFHQVRGVRVPQRILTLPMNRPQPSFTIVTIPFTANT